LATPSGPAGTGFAELRLTALQNGVASLSAEEGFAPPAQSVRPRPRSLSGSHLLLALSDFVAMCASELVALSLFHGSHAATGPRLTSSLLLAIPLPLVTVAAIAANGLYVRWPHQLLNSSFSEMRDIVYSLSLSCCVVLGFGHFSGLERRGPFESITVVAGVLVGAAALPTARALTRALLRAAAVEQFRVIIVGSGMMASHIARYLSWDRRITLVGSVDDEPVPGEVVLGGIDDLPRLCDELAIDQVVVGFSRTHPARSLERLRMVNSGVAISVVPRYFELLSPRSRMKELAGLPIIDIAPAQLSPFARAVKRCFDVVVAFVLLILSAPLLTATAIAVKLTSSGPIVFTQERVGYRGERFVMYKFRTMSARKDGPGAMSLLSDMEGPLFKMRQDPRVTRVGHFLRRSSLDELQQLFNVLRGTMSIVGPRPFIPSESAQMDGAFRRRFEVRPGMTGLWQISGRSHLSFDELVRLDYLYVASWSLWWDMRILWHTPARVFKGHGAY
ncbi:MAG: sugar transferase, partial [Acidimicrobiales bacterium]